MSLVLVSVDPLLVLYRLSEHPGAEHTSPELPLSCDTVSRTAKRATTDLSYIGCQSRGTRAPRVFEDDRRSSALGRESHPQSSDTDSSRQHAADRASVPTFGMCNRHRCEYAQYRVKNRTNFRIVYAGKVEKLEYTRRLRPQEADCGLHFFCVEIPAQLVHKSMHWQVAPMTAVCRTP